MSQNHQILNHLRSGNDLTPLDALQQFGCFRLAARISELRGQGHTIVTELMTTDAGKQVARYRVVTEQQLLLFC